MKNDWAAQWFKLAGKCMAWIAGIGIVAGIVFFICLLFDGTKSTGESWVAVAIPLMVAGYACFCASIPVAIFTSFIIALRAFGRQP